MEATAVKTWRDDNITPKQKATIIKMQGILGWSKPVPIKKGPAADLISELMNEAELRVSVTGTMGYNSDYDRYGMDDDEGPEFGND